MEAIYLLILISILTLYYSIKLNLTICPTYNAVNSSTVYQKPKVSEIFKKMFSEPTPRQGGIGMDNLTTPII